MLESLRRRAGGAARDDPAAPTSPVAPWWPFAARETLPAVSGVPLDEALLVEASDPPDPPDAVLARCAPLDVDVRDVPALERLRAAYDALVPGAR